MSAQAMKNGGIFGGTSLFVWEQMLIRRRFDGLVWLSSSQQEFEGLQVIRL